MWDDFVWGFVAEFVWEFVLGVCSSHFWNNSRLPHKLNLSTTGALSTALCHALLNNNYSLNNYLHSSLAKSLNKSFNNFFANSLNKQPPPTIPPASLPAVLTTIFSTTILPTVFPQFCHKTIDNSFNKFFHNSHDKFLKYCCSLNNLNKISRKTMTWYILAGDTSKVVIFHETSRVHEGMLVTPCMMMRVVVVMITFAENKQGHYYLQPAKQELTVSDLSSLENKAVC